MNHLFSSMFRGDSVTLRVVGVSSSVPLFNAAIQSIRLDTAVNFMDENGGACVRKVKKGGSYEGLNHKNEDLAGGDKDEGGNKDSSRPDDNANEDLSLANDELTSGTNRGGAIGHKVLSDVKITGLELVPSPNNSTELGLKGTISVSFWNPLGGAGTLDVLNVAMRGLMALKIDKETKNNKEKPGGFHGAYTQTESNEDTLPVALFHGTLVGLKRAEPTVTESGAPVMRGLGLMPAHRHSVDMKMHLLLQLTDDGKPFQQFLKSYIKKDETTLSLLNVNATATLRTSSLGHVKLADIPLGFDMKMVGFNSFKSAKVSSFFFESLPFLPGSFQDKLRIAVGVSVNSESPVSLTLGTLRVSLNYKGSHVAFLTAEDCQIGPGMNEFKFSGDILIREIEFPLLLSFGRSYFLGRSTKVEVEFVPPEVAGAPPVKEEDGAVEGGEAPADALAVPDWIQKALVGMKLEVDLRAMNRNGGGSSDDGLGLFNGRSREVEGGEVIDATTFARRPGILKSLWANLMHGNHTGG